MLENIPAELRQLDQWVVAGSNKEPINARTGARASVTDPSTWSTFYEAKHAGYLHIGFVLAQEDPYTIIDLDEPQTEAQKERHLRIYQAFDSYSELSQSGQGIHIIVKGHIPTGVRRDKVEVYSALRYMICTGSVIRNSPIVDHQPLLEAIHAEMASTVSTTLEEREAVLTDEGLYDMASNAVNGAKFLSLWAGDLTGYPSQSEADFALLTILCFYSKSDSQVRLLFRYSALGSRDKAQRNDSYIDRALAKIRAKQATPYVDLTDLLNGQESLPFTDAPAPHVEVCLPPPIPTTTPQILYPPGLIGEMAEYVYSSAIRPVHEVALSAAIALGAGIVGRHYNISSTGLNQYIILLARTGTGKEGAIGGIDALLASIRDQIPDVDQFVGPGTFASGQALTRVLDKTPCFVSVLGEVGITLQQICDKNAGSHNVQLKKVLLDIYAKSGWNKWLRPSVYSDSEKNTLTVRAPNVTILGESTQDNFYGALESVHIGEGLVPRFLVIEYDGPRPPANQQAFHRPSPALSSRLLETCQTAITMRCNEVCCPVQVDRWAAGTLEVFNVEADDRINGAGEDEVLKQLWNRAHIKALKLAALIAVGCSIHQPIVTREVAEWCLALVRKDIENMTAKFSQGAVGIGDHTQELDIRKACERYPQLTERQRTNHKVPKSLLDKGNLVPYSYLKHYLMQRASFKSDRRGAITAIKISLEDCVKSGMLALIPPDQAYTQLHTSSPVYYRGESW